MSEKKKKDPRYNPTNKQLEEDVRSILASEDAVWVIGLELETNESTTTEE